MSTKRASWSSAALMMIFMVIAAGNAARTYQSHGTLGWVGWVSVGVSVIMLAFAALVMIGRNGSRDAA